MAAPAARSALKGIVAPSILAADFGRLHDECRAVLDKGARAIHVDVMDGHFVPNLVMGAPVVKSLRRSLGPSANLDCHLMVTGAFHSLMWVKWLHVSLACCIVTLGSIHSSIGWFDAVHDILGCDVYGLYVLVM